MTEFEHVIAEAKLDFMILCKGIDICNACREIFIGEPIDHFPIIYKPLSAHHATCLQLIVRDYPKFFILRLYKTHSRCTHPFAFKKLVPKVDMLTSNCRISCHRQRVTNLHYSGSSPSYFPFDQRCTFYQLGTLFIQGYVAA
jgi:hypothetical protein